MVDMGRGTRARKLTKLLLAVLLWAEPAVACFHSWCELGTASMSWTASLANVLSPEKAMRAYQEGVLRQLATPVGYSDQTTIEAEIPSIAKNGQCSLTRTFSPTQSLTYTAVNFVGDTFVKTNVIYRLLEEDAERVGKRTGLKVAILESNYRFSFKGIEDLNGRALYAFAVKPRRRETGLFKGKILIDPQNGHIVRAVGRLSKSPSWWIKRIDFIQDYVDVADFTVLAQMQSVTQARIVGRIVVNIRHCAYKVPTVEQLESAPDSTRSGSTKPRWPDATHPGPL